VTAITYVSPPSFFRSIVTELPLPPWTIPAKLIA